MSMRRSVPLVLVLVTAIGCARPTVEPEPLPEKSPAEEGVSAAGETPPAVAAPCPKPELLVEPSVLAAPAAAKEFVILDARDRKAFDAGRVPCARWVDAAAWAKAFGGGADAEGWSRRIGGLGVGCDAKVVVYDDASSKDAARIWWILRYWGLSDVRLLNGGWRGWQAAGLTLETDKPATVAAVEFQAAPRRQRLATKGQLLESLKDASLQIVDARSQAEFCGTDKQKNQRGGAIPGAKQLEWSDLLEKTTQRFKPPEELRALFRQAGIEPGRPTAAYCQSGGRASVMAFAMELMGASAVRNYYASWAEWGNADDTPIVVKAAQEP